MLKRFYATWPRPLASQKQSLPSFASILPVLSIVFYCSGFLRVELEPVNEQKKRINALENNEETTSSDVRNQIAKKTRGKLYLIWFSIETEKRQQLTPFPWVLCISSFLEIFAGTSQSTSLALMTKGFRRQRINSCR